MPKIDIALKILKLLNEHPQISANTIATELGISARSVFRYVDELTCCGYPIYTTRGRYGGLYLDREFKTRKSSAIELISPISSPVEGGGE